MLLVRYCKYFIHGIAQLDQKQIKLRAEHGYIHERLYTKSTILLLALVEPVEMATI